ncbi:MAG: proline--tRNA ligase [Chloroflexi bacterium]|nr:MAG: proline--tRNA ligase [Chloroflexota bacterium]
MLASRRLCSRRSRPGSARRRAGRSGLRARRKASRSSVRPGYPSRVRASHLFFATLRDDPAEAEMASHRLLIRAGYVRQLGSGIYSLLPLGYRATSRVEQVIREEIDRIGGQEMEMPVVHPAELWKESGRYFKIGPELVRFKDRTGRDMVLAMTHEEIVASLLRDIVRSYRQLPMIVYHFQTKFRDEPRARGGLLRVREFVMKDSYSCDVDQAGLDRAYQAHFEAYERIFKRLGVDAIPVGADVGIMGGSLAHEFMALNDFGEDTLVLCESCDYAANQQIAPAAKPEPSTEQPKPLEEVATPGTTTIATLTKHLGIGAERTAKAAFFVTGDGRLVTAIVRGDHDVNETKLFNAAKAVGGLRPARVEEIRAAGMEPGYGSPIGAHDTVVLVDAIAAASPNLVAGANREGFHYRNVNVGRDFTPDQVVDLVNARAGAPAASRWSCGRGSRSATSSSWERTFPWPPARRSSARMGRPTPSSWARTASAWGGPSPVSSRPTTTTRASSGPPRWRRTRPISCRSAAPARRGSPKSPSAFTRSPSTRAARSSTTTATSRRA